MNHAESAYQSYLYMCRKLGCPVMTQAAYEKAVSGLNPAPNNTDAILRNNNRKKDR